jgi:hypothetical protein
MPPGPSRDVLAAYYSWVGLLWPIPSWEKSWCKKLHVIFTSSFVFIWVLYVFYMCCICVLYNSNESCSKLLGGSTMQSLFTLDFRCRSNDSKSQTFPILRDPTTQTGPKPKTLCFPGGNQKYVNYCGLQQIWKTNFHLSWLSLSKCQNSVHPHLIVSICAIIALVSIEASNRSGQL